MFYCLFLPPLFDSLGGLFVFQSQAITTQLSRTTHLACDTFLKPAALLL